MKLDNKGIDEVLGIDFWEEAAPETVPPPDKPELKFTPKPMPQLNLPKFPDILASAIKALAGQGLMGVARDNYPQDGQTFSFVASFAEVEVDVETGSYKIVDFLAVADVGTVIHPKALGGQIMGRSMLGIAHAIGQKWVFDQHLGAPLAKRFYNNKPPTILDAPVNMEWAALDRKSTRLNSSHSRASRMPSSA